MMYSEFIEGVHCRDTEKNYQVFKGLEMVYMATDCSKEDIYKVAKSFVDNSLTESQQQQVDELEHEISIMNENIDWCDRQLKSYLHSLIDCEDKEERSRLKEEIKSYKSSIASYKGKIKWFTQSIEQIKRF